MDQIVNFIEEKDNKHIELDLYRTDYDTISRKQEKLRLSSKTISKAELMDEEVNISEKFYKKAKKEVNDMESNFQNEIDRFQMDKSIFIMRGLKNFIDFQLSVIQSTKKIYEENWNKKKNFFIQLKQLLIFQFLVFQIEYLQFLKLLLIVDDLSIFYIFFFYVF